MKILFWTGYTEDFTGMEEINYNSPPKSLGWGSEGSLYRLALSLNQLGHKVYIFGDMNLEEAGYDIRDYDAIVVQRYLNYVLYQTSNHPNVILWLHDVTALHWFDGVGFPNLGIHLYENAVNGGIFRKSVVLTPFHERKIRSLCDIPASHFAIIGHGIDQKTETNKQENKIPFKMIWTSDWIRGLKKTIQILNHIPHEEVPIILEIFGEGATPTRSIEHYAEESPSLEQVINDSPHQIIIRPRVSNEEIITAWSEVDFWFYPTDFEETYCITALEAQKAGAFCFTSNVGSLPDVIQDRGFIYHDGENNDAYYNKLSQVLKYYLLNPQDTGDMRLKAAKWAKGRSSIEMAKEWEGLLSEGVRTFKFFD